MSPRPSENGTAVLQQPAGLPGTMLTKDQP